MNVKTFVAIFIVLGIEFCAGAICGAALYKVGSEELMKETINESYQ